MSSYSVDFRLRSEKEYGTRLHGKLRHTVLMEKINEMKKTVDGFESKYSKQYCTELLRGKWLKLCDFYRFERSFSAKILN